MVIRKGVLSYSIWLVSSKDTRLKSYINCDPTEPFPGLHRIGYRTAMREPADRSIGGRPHAHAWRFCIGLLVIMLLLCPATLAQSLNGSIGGSVTDSSGKAISGAAVTLTAEDTGRKRTATSDSLGRFTI